MHKLYFDKLQAVPVMTLQSFKDTFPTPATTSYTTVADVIKKIQDYAATIDLPIQVDMNMPALGFDGIYNTSTKIDGNPAPGNTMFGGIDGAISLQLTIDKNNGMNRWFCRGWLFTDANNYTNTTPTIYAVGSPYGNEDSIWFAPLPAITWGK